MKRSESIAKLTEALSKFQGQIENAPKDSSNPYFKSFYTDLAGAWNAIRKALSENGLAIIQDARIEGDGVFITSVLAHGSGEWIESEVGFTPKDLSPQAVGASITYGRRYLLMAQTGLAGEDDDAESATDHKGNGKAEPKAKPLAPEAKKEEKREFKDFPEVGVTTFGKIMQAVNKLKITPDEKLKIVKEATEVKGNEEALVKIYDKISNGTLL